MLCPFSVHSMALTGKDREGRWATAAGAIKCVDVAIMAGQVRTLI
jgi:hypothetical protein